MLDFQKYNIKEKKQKGKRKKNQNKTRKPKQRKKKNHKNYLKTPTTTTQRLYIVFTLKNSLCFEK